MNQLDNAYATALESFNKDVKPLLDAMPKEYKRVILNAVSLAIGREAQAPNIDDCIEEANVLILYLIEDFTATLQTAKEGTA